MGDQSAFRKDSSSLLKLFVNKSQPQSPLLIYLRPVERGGKIPREVAHLLVGK